MGKIIVKPKEGEEALPVEILEAAIVEIAKGYKKLSSTRLSEETLVVLLHDSTKISKSNIRRVLYCLPRLEQMFLKTQK